MRELLENKDAPLYEVNLKELLQKIWDKKLYFIVSVGLFVGFTFLYIKIATPIYEVSSSILIDASGENRVLGNDSKYLDGGVKLMEMEKNLFNEVGILHSFSLVRETVEDLGLNVSYYAGHWYKKEEKYGYFPFEVIVNKHAAQLYNVPFEVEIISKDQFILTIEADEFFVSNPQTGTKHKVERDFHYSEEHSFGQSIRHDYFNFLLKRPDYNVPEEDFKDLDLSFIIHDYDQLANTYMSKLNVENIDIKASILKISLEGPIVKKDVEFLSRLTENYIENKITARNKIALVKEEFIRNQLASISDSLAKAEMDLEAFKRNRQAVNLSATAISALEQSQQLQSEKAKIEFNIKYYNSLIQYIGDSSGTKRFIAPSSAGINDPLLKANLLELQKLYSEKARKGSHSTKDFQEMENIDLQIQKTIDLLLENLNNLIQASELALQETDEQLSNYRGIIYSLPSREKQLLNIQRKSTLYENLYNYLSQELAKTGIASAESTSDTRVLDPARMIGNGPVSPKKTLLLLLAVILGSVIPLGWIVLKDTLDDTIQSVTQIKKNTAIPVIASIAHYTSKSLLSASDLSQWRVEESFRDLSANLQYLIPKNQNWVIGVTSSIPNEGKTFCAINLGIKLAETGKKILIIDADLRNPSLSNDIEEFKGKGLSNYLSGEIDQVNSIIYKHEKLKYLEFIPTQVVEDNIHELLSGSKMQTLINDFKTKYDFVIIDSPAVGLVSDYLLFSSIIDINLFVIRRNVSKVTCLNDFEKLLTNANGQKSFIIFNDAVDKEYKYGYSKKYGKMKSSYLISESLST